VIDPSSAAAALQKALSALGSSSTYSSADRHTTQTAGYADPSDLRARPSDDTDSFYDAYIIRPTVVERSTIDSKACQGNVLALSTDIGSVYSKRLTLINQQQPTDHLDGNTVRIVSILISVR